MNVTHRFKRFLNNSAQRHGFRLDKLFVKMIIRCDTRSPEVFAVMNDRLMRASTEPKSKRGHVARLASRYCLLALKMRQ